MGDAVGGVRGHERAGGVPAVSVLGVLGLMGGVGGSVGGVGRVGWVGGTGGAGGGAGATGMKDDDGLRQEEAVKALTRMVCARHNLALSQCIWAH